MSVQHNYFPKLQHLKIESLKSQYELLKILRLRHLHWLTSTDDPQIQARHQKLADLIEHTMAHYGHLLQLLQLPRNGEGE